MTKIDIFSGFLGAGKTTLIRKLIKEAYQNEKIMLIENEFGEIGVDSDFLRDADIEIKEINQGCICCSLVGDFTDALNMVIDQYHPDRIIIEPSGVGKLSDVIKAASKVVNDEVVLNSFTTVCDSKKVIMYSKNFGEFYNDQIENANCIVLSRSQFLSSDKLDEIVSLLREHNSSATIITTEWDSLDGKTIVEAMEKKDSLANDIQQLEEHVHHHHHHHDDEDEEECCCHHDHEEGEEQCCCHHHHDEDDEECCCHHHEHDEDDEECCCHHHDHDEEEHNCHHEHDHRHHHHADEVFTSWGMETNQQYSSEEISELLNKLNDTETYGQILRAKGIVKSNDGKWIYFDYVPEETDVRYGNPIAMGRLCVIGSKINEENIKSLFSK